jgi:capsular exopolysaccharide synthesis family protein
VDARDPLAQEASVNLHDYWMVVSKHRWIIILFFLPVVLIAAISEYQAVPVYTAQATIYLENETPNVMGMLGVSTAFTAGSSSALDYYKTQESLLLARSLVAQVIQDLGLDRDPRFQAYTVTPLSSIERYANVQFLVKWVKRSVRRLQARFEEPEEPDEERQAAAEPPAGESEAFEFGVHPSVIDTYLSRLWVGQVPGTQLIRVTFSSLNPAFSKEVANAHATTFIRTSLTTRFQLTTEAQQFLEERLLGLKATLAKSEEEFDRFRKTHAIVPLEKGENLVVDRLRGLNADLTMARSKRIELESLYRVVQQRDSRALSYIIDNPVVQQLKAQISLLEKEKARLATTFRPTYPGVTALQEEIDQVNKRITQEVDGIVRTITADYAAAKAKEKALIEEVEQARQAAMDLREKAVEAAILEREVESNRTLYEAVLRRSKETDLTGAVPTSNIRVVDRADLPLSSDASRGKRLLLLSVVVGLLGGVGLAFLRHHMDNTLKTPDDVGRFLHLPTLGVVPNIERLRKRPRALGYVKNLVPRRGLPIPHHPLSLAHESYQAICTALQFSQPDRPPRTIVITSAQPKEGKTVTALNVATTLARNGSSVLLIDADLRNGDCHRRLGVENSSGLTNALSGNREVTDLIKATAVPNLSLLPRGEIPPNPPALLGSLKMRQLLDSLETMFAFIIIDSAPLLPITDTVLLCTMVDGVVLVTKGHTISRNVAHQACGRLIYVRAKIFGVILNNIDIESPEYREYRKSYAFYYASYNAPGDRDRRM